MAFSEKRWAYSPKPIEANHSAIPVMANLWPAHATITRTGRAKAYQPAQPPVGDDRHAHRTSSGLHSSSPFERIRGVRTGRAAHEGPIYPVWSLAIRGDIAEGDPARARGNCFTLNRDFDPNARLGNMILTEVGNFCGSCFTTDQPRTKSVRGRHQPHGRKAVKRVTSVLSCKRWSWSWRPVPIGRAT